MMIKPTDKTYFNFATGAWVHPYDWQKKIRKDDYFEIVSESYPTIYGEILEVSQKDGCFRAKLYSAWCLLGKKGELWIVEPTRIITKQEFENARSLRWKVVEQNVEVEAQ